MCECVCVCSQEVCKALETMPVCPYTEIQSVFVFFLFDYTAQAVFQPLNVFSRLKIVLVIEYQSQISK